MTDKTTSKASSFRVAILDNPKLTLADPSTQKIFSDMLCVKQLNFTRTSEAYIAMGALDMISTHILIYDTTHILQPKLVLAMRVCYESRAKAHNTKLPIEEYTEHLPIVGQANVAKFRSSKKELVDCNAWFVDPEYSYSKTGLKLSDLGFFTAALYILRMGNDHLCGCSNERYKASRWVKTIGDLVEPVEFVHPKVADPHALILINKFSKKWLTDCFEQYGQYVENAFEQLPEQTNSKEALLSVQEIKNQLMAPQNSRLAG